MAQILLTHGNEKMSMRKMLSVVMIAGLCLLSVAAYAQDAAKVEPIKGFLSDVQCGAAGKDSAGVDLTKNPEKHTVQCMLTESCVKSGYGMFILDEKTNAYVFHAFDAKGSELAKSEVLDKTKDADNIAIEVNGTLDQASGVVTVTSIKAAEKAAEEPKAATDAPTTEQK